jgi:CMP-N,N'-diacetyllegionaminic acid synthase
MNTKKILTVIPARGNSKGISRKNIKLLAGKPLIAWTIETALALQAICRVIVSTDDVEIAQIARQWGADVPFLRPNILSSDSAKSVGVIIHALDWLMKKDNYLPDFVLLLQPTSPLRTAFDIKGAIKLQKGKNADAVVSVYEVSHPFSWVREIDRDRKFLPKPDVGSVSRRQDARKLYQLNGALYLIKTSVLKKELTFTPEKTYAYIMPNERSLDIDTPWDFYLADLILRDKNGT